MDLTIIFLSCKSTRAKKIGDKTVTKHANKFLKDKKWIEVSSMNWLYTCKRMKLDIYGRALTPSCEITGITTNCWTFIDRKTLELTKKDTPPPKTKEKLQWDGMRGTMRIKSNPITTGWVSHKLENNYNTEDHPLEWSFLAPRQASQPGGGIPRESDFEG